MVHPRHILSALLLAALLWAVPLQAAPAAGGPQSIAGIALGDDATQITKRIDMQTAAAQFGRPAFMRARLAPIEGYRSGYITWGECEVPGRIVRIKMNYADPSLEFFERILQALSARWGKPDVWRGDAFGTLRAWKWDLSGPDGTSVSMILSHYRGEDDTYTEGNALRIANRSWMEQEAECDRRREQAEESAAKETGPAYGPEGHTGGALPMEWFLPH